MTKEQLPMPRCDIEELKEKLDIAVEALEQYARDDFWDNCKETWTGTIVYKGLFQKDGYLPAKQALEKIKGDK